MMKSILKIVLLSAVLTVLSANISSANDQQSKAFKKVVDETMPLTPAQIELIKSMQENRQEAIIGRPANVRNRTVTLDVQPGMDPTDIVMLPAYSTTIAFYDQTGAIWPVKNATTGNPKAFKIVEQKDKESPTNIITTSCVSESGHSNLTVVLQGLDMPVMFPIKIAPAHKKTPPAIDGMLIVRINGFGPQANPPVMEPRPTDPVSDDMISYLDGVAPKGAELAKIDPPNADITAWKSGKLIFLRTKQPILWPAWTSAVRGPGQIRVYELPDVSSILVSSDGQITKYTITSAEHK